MKKLIYYQLLLVSCFLISSCSDGTIGDTFADDYYGDSGGTIVNHDNVVNGFFDLADPDNSTVGFDLVDHLGPAPSGVDVIASFRGVETTLFNTSDIPSTHVITMNDVLSAVGADVNTIEVGEACSIEFDATNGSGKFRSSDALVIPFSCSSELAGTYSYVTTNIWCGNDDVSGEVAWETVSAGTYAISDWGYGSYETCYGGSAANWGTLMLSDICSKITVLGLDNYDDTWSFIVNEVNGPDFTFS